MAEHNIANNAGTLTPNVSTTGPWICRDDSDNYWTIFQDTDGNIAIYKSLDSGATWTLMKTLTTADFTSLTFPVENFNIINLTGQNKIYIYLSKRSTQKMWGWLINTLTDAGAKDLDNVSFGTAVKTVANQIRWNNYNHKLYLAYGRDSLGYAYYSEVNLDGTLAASTSIGFSNGYYFGSFAIDSQGNFFIFARGDITTFSHTIYKNIATTYKVTTYKSADFQNILCDYNDKVVFGFVVGTVMHLYRADNSLTTFEIDDSQKDLSAGHTPTISFLTIDGNNDIYWVYTDSYDNEAYYVKYTVADSSWGSAIKISSNNDGKLICPEIKSPLLDNQILVTYQATA